MEGTPPNPEMLPPGLLPMESRQLNMGGAVASSIH